MTLKRRTCRNCGKEIWYGYWPAPPSEHPGAQKHWYHTHSNNAQCLLQAEPDRP